MSNKYILSINPGSTSTKVAVFLEEERLFEKKISHSIEELSKFDFVIDQRDFRRELILNFLKENSFDITLLSAVVGRGGMLTPLESGTYLVNEEMIDYLSGNVIEHASNLGAILAKDIAGIVGVDAFIVDPIVVDEMDDVARITGIPEIQRLSVFHALNQKAAAREAAKRLNKRYEDCNFIVCHLGGGITIGAHKHGRVVDVNNGLNGEGPFTPERAGTIPAWDLVQMAFSKKYSLPAIKKKLTGKGGLVAHLGTNDVREVIKMIDSGDRKANLILDSMIYNIAKHIGSLAPVFKGNVDLIILTGGIAYNDYVVKRISDMVSFISKVMILPGEDEMRSLTLGALRVLRGVEKPKIWKYKGGKN